MNKYYRPTIQNGNVAKRTRPAQSVRFQAQKSATNTWQYFATAIPGVAGVAAHPFFQTALHFFGLDEKLQTEESAAKVQTKTQTRALVLLLTCGLFVAAAFIFSLRDHFTAYAFGRDEVKVKAQIDAVTAEKRLLEMQRGQALSPQEVANRAQASTDLRPIELDRGSAAPAAATITTTGKEKKPTVAAQKMSTHKQPSTAR